MIPKVLVLLSAYNGERYLQEQVESILKQEGVETFLLIRDDKSSDGTVELIKRIQMRYPGRIQLVEGRENIGCTRNFIELMRIASSSEMWQVDYYAFSDQDDIWMPDKLLRSTTALSKMDASRPLLFCGESVLTDSNMHEMSRAYMAYTFTFGSSLVMNSSGGHTQVFNKILLDEASRVDFCPYILHDWWIYCVCMALSGQLCYEATPPLLYYRQHIHQCVGVRKKSWMKRIKGGLFQTSGMSSLLAKALYDGYKGKMSVENERLVRLVVRYKDSFLCRFRLLCALPRLKTKNLRTNIRVGLSVLFGTF